MSTGAPVFRTETWAISLVEYRVPVRVLSIRRDRPSLVRPDPSRPVLFQGHKPGELLLGTRIGR